MFLLFWIRSKSWKLYLERIYGRIRRTIGLEFHTCWLITLVFVVHRLDYWHKPLEQTWHSHTLQTLMLRKHRLRWSSFRSTHTHTHESVSAKTYSVEMQPQITTEPSPRSTESFTDFFFFYSCHCSLIPTVTPSLFLCSMPCSLAPPHTQWHSISGESWHRKHGKS